MSTRTPTLFAVVIALAGAGLYVTKKANAQKELDRLAGKLNDLRGQLSELERMKADTARIRSETGTREAIDADQRALLGRALGKSELVAVFGRLRETAKRYALGPFDAAKAVRQGPPLARSSKLAKVDFTVEIATDWPRLGAVLGEVRALAPRVVLEEMTIRRAEGSVPLLGVRLILVALVADEGGIVAAAPATEDRFEGPSPFYLDSEIAEGRSRRMPAVWTPPRVELVGIIYTKGSSHVIVNDEPVLEGKTFKAGDSTVKVLEVSPAAARFQIGERIFERELAPLRGGK